MNCRAEISIDAWTHQALKLLIMWTASLPTAAGRRPPYR